MLSRRCVGGNEGSERTERRAYRKRDGARAGQCTITVTISARGHRTVPLAPFWITTALNPQAAAFCRGPPRGVSYGAGDRRRVMIDLHVVAFEEMRFSVCGRRQSSGEGATRSWRSTADQVILPRFDGEAFRKGRRSKHLVVDFLGPAVIAVLSALTHTQAAASPFICHSREQCVLRCLDAWRTPGTSHQWLTSHAKRMQ